MNRLALTCYRLWLRAWLPASFARSYAEDIEELFVESLEAEARRGRIRWHGGHDDAGVGIVRPALAVGDPRRE